LEGHLILASAVLKEVIRDIRKGPGGMNRSHFLSALGFLRSPLFASICEGLGMDPVVAKAKILSQVSTKPRSFRSIRNIRNKKRWQPRREWTVVRRKAANQ